MKKRTKKEIPLEPPQPEVNVADLLKKIQEQLVILEKKLDVLATRQSEMPVERPRPVQHFERTRNHAGMKQDRDFRERILHKAICADCKKECEVPFKPSGERPVYCKECFGKRKSGGMPPQGSRDDRQGRHDNRQVPNDDRKGYRDNRHEPRENAVPEKKPFYEFNRSEKRASGNDRKKSSQKKRKKT